MPRSFLRVSIFALPLFLAACGDGWEAQKTTEFSPYGNSRTAGSGVVYVRAQLMPKKDLKLEPELSNIQQIEEPAAVPVEDVQPALDAEEIFSEAQTKGKRTEAAQASHKPQQHASSHTEHTEKLAVIEDTAPLLSKGDVEEGFQHADERDHAVIGTPVGDDAEVVVKEVEAVDLTVPKHVREKEAMGFESGLMQSDLSPEAGDVLDEVVFIEVEHEDLAEKTLRQPIKEILVPKRDSARILSVGQETLDEIYNTPF